MPQTKRPHYATLFDKRIWWELHRSMAFKKWLRAQIHPFSYSYVSHYDIEDEVRIPGYWKKGKFLKDKGFWLGLVLLVALFWFICR